MQAVIPQGLSAGDTFLVPTAPAQPVQMERELHSSEDAAAARALAAKMVGNWNLEGKGCPCIWQMPFTYTGQFVVHRKTL